MDHQDKAASIVHAAKNQLQLLQPELITLINHKDAEVQTTGAEIARQLDEVNQQLVMMLSLYRLEETTLVTSEAIYVEDLFHAALDQINDSRLSSGNFDQDLEVFGDRRLLQAAIGDAIHNALRHCKESVSLNAEIQNKGVLIRVTDDGRDTTAVGTGSGVGLWIANRIAEAHRNGGQIGFARHDFDPQYGSCFKLYLP